MDSRLGGQYSRKGAQAAAALALRCLHIDTKNRLKFWLHSRNFKHQVTHRRFWLKLTRKTVRVRK
ncbi:hypothetical protein CASFOL_022835 [Castilleja foliolosa]|uniref:Uncharacterized protein n=1 Tax=Castilleja foliolosa TaxID=1961234 RepID=A0ABD3CTH6_9LAMI